MKKKTVIDLGFVLSLIFLVAIMHWSGSFLDQFAINDKEESYVFKLTVQLNELLRSLKNESTEQRLSISVGNRSNIESYRAAIARVDDNLARLWSLTEEKPRYRSRLYEILPLIEQRRALLEGGVEKRIDDPAARALIREIRARVSALKDQLLVDLRESSALQQESLKRIRVIMIAKSLAVALLFSAVFFLLRRELARHVSTGAKLLQDRDALDEMVLQRTAELVQANEQLTHEMAVRRRAEEALHNLHGHSQVIREQERLRISRDIHDEIGQSLTALKLDLTCMQHSFLPGNREFVGRLNQMRSFLDRLIETVQNIVAELRPPLLDSLGVVEAIDWQVKEFRRRNGIACEVDLDERVNLVDEQVATAILRIVMEALTNVSRHAHASKVRVALQVGRGGEIELQVADDGRGISDDGAEASTSLGLLGMRERARLCGGTLTITGAPGAGCTVTLSVPAARFREDG